MKRLLSLLLLLGLAAPLAAAEPKAPLTPAKPAASPATVMFPRGASPILSFRPPEGWVVSVPPDGSAKMSVAKPRGPGVIMTSEDRAMTDAEMADLATSTARASVEVSSERAYKPGPVKPAALGAFKGIVVESPGQIGSTPIVQRIYVLRSPKGKCINLIMTGPPDPLPAEIRAFLDSIAPTP